MSKKSDIKEALKSTPARPLDPSALSNDQATLRALVGALNSTPRGVDPNAPVDTTKYDAPTGAANATLLTDTSVDESREAALNAALAAQRKGATEQQILDAAKAAQKTVPPGDPGHPFSPLPTPQQAAQPAPAPQVTAQRARRLVFTGRGISGFASQLPWTFFQLDRTAHDIAKFFFPTSTPETPSYANFLKEILVCGTGEITEHFPMSAERACFVDLVRTRCGDPKYGTDAGYWTDAVVAAIKALDPEEPIILSGVNDVIQLRYFQAMGFQHWHLTGPALPALDKFSTMLDGETIKALSAQRQGPKLRVVWTDNSPCNPRLWTTQEFLTAFRDL